jgi:hypothetical protein
VFLCHVPQYSTLHIAVRVKGKVVPVLFLTEHHAMKAYWENGSIAPLDHFNILRNIQVM